MALVSASALQSVTTTLSNGSDYSDACEWENLKSIFHPDAYIYTTWTGKTHHLDFIAASQKGMDNGAFIMHRCHGTSTDINTEATRAVTKMKATITQRFFFDDGEADAESDCRFCFFWVKTESGEWRARYVRHWYEKVRVHATRQYVGLPFQDKLIPVNPNRVPKLDEEALQRFPSGYRYLAYCQEKTMGVKVLLDMPGHRREQSDIPGSFKKCGDKHDLLYWQSKKWVEGEDVEF
jgi:hypothetical protein